MSDKLVKYKIVGLPSDREYSQMPFGRQIEFRHKISAFVAEAKTTWLSKKRISYTKVIRDFCKLYNVTEFYCTFFDGPNCSDDTFQVWYKTATLD